MKHSEAYAQAAASGTIQLKKPTADIMKAVAEFNETSDNMINTIVDNLSEMMNDNSTINRFTEEYYRHFYELTQVVYSMVGRSVLNEGFSTLDFKGL